MVSAGSLRVVFFGTPAFAVPTLDALLGSDHAVVGVVTRADRPRGRGQKTSDLPVKARAIEAGVPVFQPERLNDPAFLTALLSLNADLGVVAAYGKILNEPVLAAPRLGLLNVHASLLPRYRGAAPVHRAIIDGEATTGVTIMRVVKALDAGPLLATARRAIEPEETSEELERDLARLGAPLLVSVADALATGPVPEVAQDEAAAIYAHRITRADGVVDWSRPAVAIHNLIRGLHPWPHAYTYHRGQRLILLRSRAPEGLPGPKDPAGPEGPARHAEVGRVLSDPAVPGTIVEAAGDVLRVATGDGVLAIAQLHSEGRRPMTAREFLAGARLSAGDLLTREP